MDSMYDLWREVAQRLHDDLGDSLYNVWVKSMTPVAIDDIQAILKVPSNVHRDLVVPRYTDLIHDHLQELTGKDLNIIVAVDDELDSITSRRDPSGASPADNYEYTFDSFVVGSSNQFANAAAHSVSENPGGAYNPLFIYGPSGLGKTHLLFAIRDYILRSRPTFNVIYIKGDQFTNEMIDSIAKGQQKDFRQKYRFADVLLIDDVQFIGGKVSTQEEFFHTFNTLHQAHKQIVLTSDRPPKEIQTLEERLRTRFESGLIADIQPPEFETRVAIIKNKAAQLNLDMPEKTAEFIAGKISSNIRQLEGVVKKMKVLCSLSSQNPSISTANVAIRDILTDDEAKTPIAIDRIIDEVARSFEVRAEDIISEKRNQPISLARQVAMYCVREVLSMSYEAIGKEFGGRDHTTVIYAVQQIAAKLRRERDFRARVEDIIKNIKSM